VDELSALDGVGQPNQFKHQPLVRDLDVRGGNDFSFARIPTMNAAHDFVGAGRDYNSGR
jgi:hypothetical protein